VSRLRLGVIGAGAWTVASHLPNLVRRGEELEFVAVNRRDLGKLESIRRRFGFAQGFTDYRDVLAQRLDICVIGSPAAAHHEHARAALESGAHVLVEKPFTIDPEDAWDLVDVARRVERELIVAFGANHQPMMRAARRLMTEGDGIGQVEHVAVYMASPLREQLRGRPTALQGSPDDPPEELVPDAGTHADPALSGGGYAAAQLSHALGLALWLTGLRGREVFAVMSLDEGAGETRAPTVDLHDAAVVVFEGGAIGTVAGASSHPGALADRHQQEVRLIGTEGQLHVDVERERVWRYRPPGNHERIPLEEGDGRYDCRGPVDALVDLAAGRDVGNASPGELGARVVEVVAAMYRSAATGVPASISSPTARSRPDG
jgi:predicted dehydrogenase